MHKNNTTSQILELEGRGAGRLGSGAGEWTRTTDLLITNQLLCQLSYTGTGEGAEYTESPGGGPRTGICQQGPSEVGSER